MRAGSLRTFSWFNYFSDEIDITVVTRNWNYDKVYNWDNYFEEDSVADIFEEISENKRIYRISNKHNWYFKFKNHYISKYFKFNRLLHFFEGYLKWSRWNTFSNERGLLFECRRILSNEKFDIIITSGEPFVQFKFVYQLHLEFGIPYILDYRDPWINNFSRRFGIKIGQIKLEKKRERLYLEKALFITTISSKNMRLINFLLSFDLQKKIELIPNGLDDSLLEMSIAHNEFESTKEEFVLTFIGTLYPQHNVQWLLKVLQEIIEIKLFNVKPVLRFIGTISSCNPKQRSVIEEFAARFPENTQIFPLLPQKEVWELMFKSDLLIKFNAFVQEENHFGKKLYEYAASGKMVLSINSNSEIPKWSPFLKNRVFQIFCGSEDEVRVELKKLISHKNNYGYPKKNNVEISDLKKYINSEITQQFEKVIKSRFSELISSSIRASKTEIKQKNQNNFSRILIISQHIFPIQSPRANRTTELIKELARQGHQVVVYAVLGKYDYSEFLLEYPSVVLKKIELNWMYHSYNSDGDGKRYLLDKVLSRTLGPRFLFPDFEFFYKTIKILKIDNQYDALISIAEPHQIHWGIARYRKMNPKKFPKVWIADCGDPFINNNLNDYIKKKYIKYEHEFCQQSDYITIPEPQSALGFQKEYQNKLKIIPQGFAFDLKRNTLQPKNDVITFAYAGTFNKKFRNPKKLLEILSLIDRPFQFHIFSNQTELVKPFKNILGEKLVLRDQIPREELLLELEKMNFLVNLENFNLPSQVPSKLIDYAIAGRPILNLKSENPNKNEIFEFLSENYQAEYKIQNLEKYNISNVVREFMKIINH